jgi:DNA-binding MarR family transcriptional regulator/DNA-binding transcriptional regulator YhcF (GntR family)
MQHGKTAAEILAHPRFAAARRAHVDALVGLFAGDRFVTRLMADAGAIALRGLLAGFHAAYDESNRATWATPGQVRKLIAERGLASPRRVDDLLARFRQAGYVVPGASPNDRRVRILRPSERLLAHDRDHLAVYHRFLHDLYPERGYEWALRKDARVQLAVRRAAFHALPQAFAFMRHRPFMLLLSRDAGYLAFLLVAQATLSGGEHRPSFTAVAEPLGVSRTHVRNLFVEAEAAGYVRLGRGGGGLVEIMPSMWEAYDRFLADVEADQDAIAQTAFAGLKKAAAPPVARPPAGQIKSASQ